MREITHLFSWECTYESTDIGIGLVFCDILWHYMSLMRWYEILEKLVTYIVYKKWKMKQAILKERQMPQRNKKSILFFWPNWLLFQSWRNSSIKFVHFNFIAKIMPLKTVCTIWMHVTSFSSISYCSYLRLISNMLLEHIHPFYILDIHVFTPKHPCTIVASAQLL